MKHRNATLLVVAIVATMAQSMTAQMLPVKPDAIRQQLSQAQAAQGSPAKPTSPKAAPPAPPAVKPASAQAKPSAQPAPVAEKAQASAKASEHAKAPAGTKPVAGKTVAAAKTVPATATKPAAAVPTRVKATPAVEKMAAPSTAARRGAGPEEPAVAEAAVPMRDPFASLLGNAAQTGGPSVPDRLPPGKAGLLIGTMRIEGLVRGPNGMVAVVSSPQQRTYFLHEGDHIFDGQVTRITMEAISFQQTGRDASGNTEVTRRLYPNPGEQR